MQFPNGFWEELKEKFKAYPDEDRQRTYPLHPQDYARALTLQMAHDFAGALESLASMNRYDEMLELSHQIRELVDERVERHQPNTFDTPLNYIQYRFDGGEVPLFPGMYVTHPSFISNHTIGAEELNLFKTLKFELSTADRVDLMVSFVRWSGVQLIWSYLEKLAKRDVPVRVLTTNYMYYTEPKALRRLSKLRNVELKMFMSEYESFHTKAYLFERESGLHTVIIGSSNLSQSALKSGYEWNVKLPSANHIAVYSTAREHFEHLWNHDQAEEVTESRLQTYEQQYNETKSQQRVQPPMPKSNHFRDDRVADAGTRYQSSATPVEIKPNEMQRPALEALNQTRLHGNRKGVIVAATGTGKTYLSAFDAKSFQAKSLLFLAHRDELLENAKETFVDVLGNPDQCGKLTGRDRDWDKPFLFSTIQTISKEEHLAHFERCHFDYIVVDEFHHAQAATYQRVLEYFKPKFLLGLTATPERMDGRDVLELCDHNLVYEIRLRDALDEGLLAPFHYFGLSDPTVNYDEIRQRAGRLDEGDLVQALRTNQRVDHVIEMMEKFGHDGDRRMVLGFCASIDHAEYMAQEFNIRGYASAVLTGNDAPVDRRDAMARLENPADPLQVIFTVDIFNEGIDIPQVNVLLFLRPTESATIFLQQLGRGLRKSADKEYVTVLDFIGNYQKSFVVPLALSGQFNHKSFDKDSLRIAVETEFADLPLGCAVDLEPVSRQQILKKIDEVRLNRSQMLADLYREFCSLLGRSPEIEDFLYTENAPSLYFFIARYRSWVETKKKMDDLNEQDETILGSEELLGLVRQLEKMYPLKWPYEFVVLQEAVAQPSYTATVKQVIDRLRRRFGNSVNAERHSRYIRHAMQRLSASHSPKQRILGEFHNGNFHLDDDVVQTWSKAPSYLNQRLAYGLIAFQRTFNPKQFFGATEGIVLCHNYTRNDLIFLFQAGVKEGSWREGISKVRNHYLLFINLKKDERVEEHLRYHDHFIDNHQFHWQSANQTSHGSNRGQDYVFHRDRDIHIHLFVRKFESMHGATLPFTYLGEVDYVSSHGDKPMTMIWRLQNPVPNDLFMDFIR